MASSEQCACCGSTAEPEPAPDVAATTCYCPLNGVIDTVGKKYGMQIVAVLGAADSLRNGELRDRLGAASDATLSKRLAELEDAGLIARHSYNEIPPRVEYSLTPTGRELEAHLQPLLEWVADHT